MPGPRAVILAGGKGTRLRPYTTVLPKPLMPVGERPILDVVLRQLKWRGFERVTISTGYMAELIEAFFGDGAKIGIPVDYVREDEPLGTAGALALVEGLDDDFLVMNGDVLTDIDYAGLLAEHSANDAVATIATHERDVQISLGVLRFEQDDDPTKLTGYDEKPTLHYAASMGVYCFSPKVLDYIERGKRLDFPDLVLKMIAAGETVRSRPSKDFWLDIGRHDDYEQAQEDFERNAGRFLPPSA
jgi:NDP-sugar pyrophosphorylase family protein